jgi:hypothetical protein
MYITVMNKIVSLEIQLYVVWPRPSPSRARLIPSRSLAVPVRCGEGIYPRRNVAAGARHPRPNFHTLDFAQPGNPRKTSGAPCPDRVVVLNGKFIRSQSPHETLT